MKAIAILVALTGCLYTDVDGDPSSDGRLGEQFVCTGHTICDDVLTAFSEERCAPPGSEVDLSHDIRSMFEDAGCVVTGRVECSGVGYIEGDGVLRPCLLERNP